MKSLQEKAIRESARLTVAAQRELGKILQFSDKTAKELSAESVRTDSEINIKVIAPLREAEEWLEAVLETIEE